MIQEMKFAAAQRKEITEFIFDEANWQAAKQVADVEDLLTKKVDATTIGPISAAIGAPLADKANKAGIPVVVFGAFGKAMQSTVEIGAGGEIFGQQGGEFLCKELKGEGSVWAFRGIARALGQPGRRHLVFGRRDDPRLPGRFQGGGYENKKPFRARP